MVGVWCWVGLVACAWPWDLWSLWSGLGTGDVLWLAWGHWLEICDSREESIRDGNSSGALSWSHFQMLNYTLSVSMYAKYILGDWSPLGAFFTSRAFAMLVGISGL